MMIRKIAQSFCLLSPLLLAACAGADGSYTLGKLNDNIRITGAGQSSDVSAHEQGKYYFRAEQFGLAVKYFEEAVAQDPSSVDSLNGLAASYDRMGRHDLSERYYRRALALDPNNPQTLNNLGYSYLLQSRVDLAVAYLRDAQRLDSESQIVLANRKIAEEAYAEQDLEQSQERLAALPLEAVMTAPLEGSQGMADTADAQGATRSWSFEPGPVSHQPWIERSTAQVQTLVTKPQVASAGLIQSGGTSPEVVAVTSVVERPLATVTRAPEMEVVSVTSVVERPITRLPAPIRAEMVDVGTAVVPMDTAIATVQVAETPVTVMALPDSDYEGTDLVAAVAIQDENGFKALHEESSETIQTAMLSELEAGAEGYDADRTAAEKTAKQSADEAVFAFAEPIIQVAMLPKKPATPSEETVVLAALPSEGLSSAMLKSEQVSAFRSEKVEISNGAGRLNMAARMKKFLDEHGVSVYRLTNADRFNHMVTTIFYRDGWYDEARRLADLLPAGVRLEKVLNQRSDVRLELGGDLLDFDRDLYYSEKRFASATAG